MGDRALFERHCWTNIFEQWNSTFIILALITEGANEEVSIYIASEVSLDKNVCFNEEKCILMPYF